MRRLLLFLSATALSLQPSAAIDLNGNQMSDVWERKHSVPASEGANDYDGDGFSNQQESALGTNPNDRLSRAHLEMMPRTAPDELPLQIETAKGKRYEVLTTYDLLTWSRVGDSFTAEGGQTTVVTTPVPSAERGFFRYQFIGDNDLDTDGLSAWEENELGTLDSSDDSDGDGMNDAWEVGNGLNPTTNDANVDADGDGLTNSEEAYLGTNPNRKQPVPPRYAIIDLMNGIDDTTGYGSDLNNSGEVLLACWSEEGSPPDYIRRSKGSIEVLDIGTYDRDLTGVYGINDNGAVAGTYIEPYDGQLDFSPYFPVIWPRGSTAPVRLPLPQIRGPNGEPGSNFGSAFAITRVGASDVVYGVTYPETNDSSVPGFKQRMHRWSTSTSQPEQIEPLYIIATAEGDSICGSRTVNGQTVRFAGTPERIIDFHPWGVNSIGDGVGIILGQPTGAMICQDGRFNFPDASLHGINARREFVGSIWGNVPAPGAALWLWDWAKTEAVRYPLNRWIPLPAPSAQWPTFTYASKINDSGMILAQAFPPGGDYERPYLLLPVELKVVDRDDPKKKWADAKDWSSKPIYAGESCGDMVSWKLGGTETWTATTFTWTAEGPGGQTIAGPTGIGKNEWKIADGDNDTANDWLKWKPGKWKIKVQIGSTQAEFEQEVGVRTEEYFVVGSLLAEASVPITGVDASTIDHFECPEIAFRLLFQDFNDPSDAEHVPEEMEDRIYVNYRIVNTTANISPISHINPESTAEDAFGLSGDTHYRFFSRSQFKYLLDANGKLKAKPIPVGNLVDLAGETPAPCGIFVAPDLDGVRHADSGKMLATVGEDEFYYLTKVRAGTLAKDGFEKLNRRSFPWVFVKFRFKMEDGELKTKFDAGASSNPDGPDTQDFSHVPTIYVFRRYLENSAFKVEKTHQLDQNLMEYLNIGNILGDPHYR